MTWTEGTAAVLAMRVSPTNEPVALKMKPAGLTEIEVIAIANPSGGKTIDTWE